MKDVPVTVTAAHQTVSRTVNTAGSFVGRHDAAPWLYPVKGLDEAPGPIVEDGHTLFPIWGTWRRKCSNEWINLDENGHAISGRQPFTPHWETVIDFLVETKVSVAVINLGRNDSRGSADLKYFDKIFCGA